MVNLNPRPSYAGNLGVKMGIRAKSTSSPLGTPQRLPRAQLQKAGSQAPRLPPSLQAECVSRETDKP